MIYRAKAPLRISFCGGGTDVSDEFVAYCRPLIGEDWPSVPMIDGRQRFARLKPVFAERKLPDYTPQAAR